MIEPPRDYLAFGLSVRSAVALPGAAPATGLADPAIEIVIEDEPIGPIVCDDPPYRVGRDGFEFAMPGVARYRCFDGRRIAIVPEPGALEDVAAMLIATTLPALLWSRGEVVLHASCAIPPGADEAVAVLGPSGSGKSTWLAAIVAAGGRAIADDSLRIYPDGEALWGGGLPGGWFAPLPRENRARGFTAVPRAQQVSSCRLGRLCVIAADAVEPRLLHGADALKALLDNRHRPRITRLLGREVQAFKALADICRLVRIERTSVDSRNFLAMPGFFC